VDVNGDTVCVVQILLLHGSCEICIDVNKSQFPCSITLKL